MNKRRNDRRNQEEYKYKYPYINHKRIECMYPIPKPGIEQGRKEPYDLSHIVNDLEPKDRELWEEFVKEEEQKDFHDPPDPTFSEFNQMDRYFDTRYFEIDNGEIIAYRQAGEGKNTILLLHGTTACSLQMEPLMNELKGDCRVIAPCLRGNGWSSYHKPIESLKDLAYDMKQFIKGYVKDQDLFIVAHSTGAAVALHLQIILPWRIKGLLLISPLNPDGLKSDLDVKNMKDVKDFSLKQFISQMAIDRDMNLFKQYIELFKLPPQTDEQIYVQLIIMHMQESY